MQDKATAPRIIGRYALYDEIASGGMASVHVGRLLGKAGFAKTVAIKRLHAHFAREPEFVSMLLDEARLAVRVRHPNVVSTLDVVNEGGELFLVMEYVPGEALHRLLRVAFKEGARVPAAVACAIVAGTLHGLHAAHEACDERGESLGIVHRDVSPQNIMIGLDGIARVLDFGVAKAVGRLQSTRDGQLKGKIAYMAPEQVRGDGDRRVDVYAASIVLWEMLVAQRLFQASTEAALLARVAEPKVPPPRSLVPDLPAALDELVMRGLEPDPDRRFATAREMARAIEDSVPTVPASRVGDWVQRYAGASLQDLAKRIEQIEGDSFAAALPWRPSHPGALPEPAPVAVTLVDQQEAPTASMAATLWHTPPPIRRAPRRPIYLGVVAALVAVFGVAITMRRAEPPPQGSSVSGQPELVPVAPPAVPPSAVVTAASSPIPEVEPAPKPEASARRRTTVSHGLAKARGAPPSTPAKGPCPVRSYVDESGIKHFVEDCK